MGAYCVGDVCGGRAGGGKLAAGETKTRADGEPCAGCHWKISLIQDIGWLITVSFSLYHRGLFN